jgi:hypothetical protein
MAALLLLPLLLSLLHHGRHPWWLQSFTSSGDLIRHQAAVLNCQSSRCHPSLSAHRGPLPQGPPGHQLHRRDHSPLSPLNLSPRCLTTSLRCWQRLQLLLHRLHRQGRTLLLLRVLPQQQQFEQQHLGSKRGSCHRRRATHSRLMLEQQLQLQLPMLHLPPLGTNLPGRPGCSCSRCNELY